MTFEETQLLSTSRFDVVERTTTGNRGTVCRQVIQHPGAVTIIPMVDENHVCLIQNYRLSIDQTLIELPAGTLEPDEEPGRTASRELTEETGYQAQHMQHLHGFFLSPGILDEWMQLYVATDLVAGPPAREPGETIENLIVPWEQAIQWVHEQKIHDAKTMVGLLYYDSLRSTP
ncbi:MAG: NUDIX hydrolase [Planctomycetota bacterium]|nr:NUDIX hydrolase [Planctomycetota bacterium]